MTPEHLARGVRLGGYIMIGFGLFSMLSLIPALGAPIRFLADLIIWPLDGTDSLDPSTSRLLLAIVGGAFSGWGVLLVSIATPMSIAAPETLRRAALMGYTTWFLIDGIGSVLAGAPANILGNIAFLAVLVWPLRQRVQTNLA